MRPYLELRGSPHEIGQQKGRDDGDYLRDVLQEGGLGDQPGFDTWLREHAIALTNKCYPRIAEEIAGYAQGASCDPLDIYRLLFSQVRRRFSCSNLAVMTTDVGPVFAKNTDLCPWEADRIGFFHYCPCDGVPFFGYAYRASFSVQGMNAAGLCNGGTSCAGLIEDRDRLPANGCPTQFAMRQVIQFGRDSNSPANVLMQTPFFDKPCGFFFMDSHGSTCHVNRGLTVCDVLHADELPAFCTGFHQPERYEWEAGTEQKLAGNRARSAFASRHFGTQREIVLEDVVAFLRMHASDPTKPGQWCRHHPDDPHLQTTVSHICIPAEGRVLYCLGNPCTGTYREFRFEKMLL